jgi:RNA recognition motif-containing protein
MSTAQTTALFFGNLSFDSTEESVQAFLATNGISGTVELPRARPGARSRNGGFALVHVSSDSAESALALLHDKECDGRRLTVKIARESGGLGGQRSAERGSAPPAPRTRAPAAGGAGGFGSAAGSRPPRAERAPRTDRPPRAERPARAPRPAELSRAAGAGQKTIFLGNLSFNSTVESVAAFIAANGVVVNTEDIELPVAPSNRPRGFALVYVAEGQLQNAINALNNQECDGRTLRVTEARESGGLGGSRSAERAQ